VAVDSGQLIVEAPSGTLTDADRALIREYKPDLLRLASEMPGSRHVAEALPYLGMSLVDFRDRGALFEVRVSWLDVALWFVPTDDDVRRLMAEGVRRGRIWTSTELIQLLAIVDRTPETVNTITRVKLGTDGDIIGLRRRA
jgi:hypothetical protein